MKIDALVVGAGPVGMTMALELVRHGLSVRIVEQAD
jgi:2-polyprenyl-6-methoxyphenol hydroxylase-like FAD-dependent oxidoreductase